MQPMITEQSCLKCHAHQGYKIGDVRGGIGISIPMNLILERTAQQKKRNIILFSLLWVIGFIGLSFGYKKLDNSLQKQEQVEKAIKVQNKELIKTEKKLKKQNKEYSALNKELAASEEKIRATNEELLIAKEKAEESDRLKSAFLANMSHEIRTPMNGILGFSDLLKEPNLSGEEQKKYIEIIEKSGARMLNIINDIIDISKIESGQIKLSMSETNVNDKLEYIYTFFKPEAEKKGLKFSLKNKLLSKEATIITDPDKFLAILINLVKNAIKYTNEGTIEFGCENKGKYFEGFVKDTGIGIPKDRQEAIFERFIQADIEDKMARQGAGLGLAITKAYTEMLGGKIWLESEEGIGSTFYFTLPYKTEPEEKIVVQNVLPSDKADSQISNLKILIVEDDETSEMLISINVKEFCNKVIKARTGAEAIEACRNIPDIDLILMDIQMPDLNGYEATRQIRQFNKDVVIIAQTAFGLIGDRGKSLAAGCNDYISKPINKTELLALMQKYFNK
ncbi:MAG: response regulator [Bacteroidetes bacterium]|nr:response regulator [Bacteroidota bacterium]